MEALQIHPKRKANNSGIKIIDDSKRRNRLVPFVETNQTAKMKRQN
jgi:hypothetical protein